MRNSDDGHLHDAEVETLPLLTKAAWIFGSLFVAFILGVFIFGPATIPDYKLPIIAYISALLAGLFAVFFTGSLMLTAELPIAGNWAVQGGAGFARFLIVLFWWRSPVAPDFPLQDISPPLSHAQPAVTIHARHPAKLVPASRQGPERFQERSTFSASHGPVVR